MTRHQWGLEFAEKYGGDLPEVKAAAVECLPLMCPEIDRVIGKRSGGLTRLPRGATMIRVVEASDYDGLRSAVDHLEDEVRLPAEAESFNCVGEPDYDNLVVEAEEAVKERDECVALLETLRGGLQDLRHLAETLGDAVIELTQERDELRARVAELDAEAEEPVGAQPTGAYSEADVDAKLKAIAGFLAGKRQAIQQSPTFDTPYGYGAVDVIDELLKLLDAP